MLDRFISGVGLPRRLREVGLNATTCSASPRKGMLDDWTFSDPRPIHAAQEIMPILESVY